MPTTRDILKRVRQVELRTRRLVTDAVAGAWHSSFKGQGIDFEEVREYQVGDDVRDIDWNVTARTGTPHIKRFREERELTLILAVDMSASGNFGSAQRTKRELAAEVASVLAFSAIRNNDKVGLLLFSDRPEHFLRPRKGRQHTLRVIRDILYHDPEHPGTDIAGALDQLNHYTKRKAVVFLISDFLQGPDGRLPDLDHPREDPVFRTLALTNLRHDLICLQLTDPREHTLPDLGLLSLEDNETGELIHLPTNSSRLRQKFSDANTRRLDRTTRTLRQLGIDTLQLRPDRPYIHDLQRLFQNRAHKGKS